MKELHIEIGPEELDAAIADTLREYNVDLNEKIDRCAKQAASEAVKELKRTSPQGPGHTTYKSGWASRKAKEYGHGYEVYNAKRPGLTHLLENGHAIANQHGHYSDRVEARPHIKPAEEHAVARFNELMEEGDD